MRGSRWVWLLVGLAMLGGGFVGWREYSAPRLPNGIAKATGRIEAEQIDIATKLAGRVTEVLVEEGQMVEAGAVVARLDAAEARAQLRGAEARARHAEQALREAEAGVAQRASDRKWAEQELARSALLHEKGYAATEKLDQRRSQAAAARAAHAAAEAGVDQARSMIDAAHADVARLRTVLDDTVLTAPRRGRVQYKLVNSGEVAAAGGRIATLLDLSDVYMTIFLSAREVARLGLGDEARIVLDAAPQYTIPAKVTFVASEAQFTPKAVETADEREKLMFRVKLAIDPELLRRYEPQVKSGIRGLGYVRTSRDAAWPDGLSVRLPG